jgi:hypothetical protein
MNETTAEDSSTDWFAVRCVFHDANNGVYEERVTLWRASNLDEAIGLAESEAAEYSSLLNSVNYVGLSQAFALMGEPGHGSEVFSLIRDSDLDPEEYISHFFEVGTERQGEI